ncbi:hypothetical protein [Candidatus Cetobacterium colombiensis]|uniref:P-type conjugative transfer protein TrbJ n=1 Tax=Candidatus Cetobacterium colombiensis TaxID=3073100 RepID=A0ABU4WDJ4_9FUSO|nr:hypothetical protein [Candidatus Cetobacterium colombiensis]MDX8337102.1 hypothetical protein [Candidatus Cetobacterium colombiensis]
MRKIRSLVLLFIILGLSTLGKSISISGFGDLLNLVKTISKTQTGMNTELLDQGIKQTKQIENEINMIKNQVENLKRLGKNISDGNINSLRYALNQAISLQDQSKGFIYNQQELVNRYWDIYKKDPENFEKNTEFTEENLKKVDRELKKAKEMTQYALYDSMINSGFTAQLKSDKANLETLLNASSTTTGALQAIQATNNLLGQTNTILLDLKSVMSTMVKMNASVESVKMTEDNAKEINLDTLEADLKKTMNEELQKYEELKKQKITIGG